MTIAKTGAASLSFLPPHHILLLIQRCNLRRTFWPLGYPIKDLDLGKARVRETYEPNAQIFDFRLKAIYTSRDLWLTTIFAPSCGPGRTCVRVSCSALRWLQQVIPDCAMLCYRS